MQRSNTVWNSDSVHCDEARENGILTSKSI